VKEPFARGRRWERERKTIYYMITMYCRKRHGYRDRLCADCRVLAEYTRQRLEKCPFRENKPTCARCTVHCYKPTMREKVKTVMRYSGPRMIYTHPLLAVAHFLNGRNKIPGS